MSHDEDDLRPNPDSILQEIKKEELRKNTGKLKIFLGMSPGVGKTYAMLNTAKGLSSRGINLLVGVVETHDRKDTIAQLSGLAVLPKKKVPYHSQVLEEFDIDQALIRKPQVIMVDELAHTNAPGSRNKKRFADIIELIQAGIDVYTTLNVQHIESVNQVVKDITGVTVHETVPDSFLDLANEIIVIDLPPEDLMKRLEDGLIYNLERIKTAQENFFKVGNLTALRELTLRTAAERVDKDLREYRQSHNIQEIWKSSFHLMVAVFASPYAESSIRATRRLADALNASWIGAYVDTNSSTSDTEKILLDRNISLVRDLGGEVITTQDEDPARGLLRIARMNNVTQIVLGKSMRPWWYFLQSGGSLVSKLAKSGENIDLYIIARHSKISDLKAKTNLGMTIQIPQFLEESGYLMATIFLTWFAAGGLSQILGHMAIGFVFLLVVCVAGLFFSPFSILLLAGLFAFIHNYFFIPPLHSLTIQNSEDFLMLLLFFTTASVIGGLTAKLRSRGSRLAKREESLLISYSLAKKLLGAKDVPEILDVGASYLEGMMSYELLIVCRSETSEFCSGSWRDCLENPREKGVMDWVFANGERAGKFTDTLSASSGYYIPLKAKGKVLGVLCIHASDLSVLDGDHFSAFENLSTQLASSLERELKK